MRLAALAAGARRTGAHVSDRDGDGGAARIRRDTYLLIRGAYDKPGEKVEPGVPAVLPPLPAGAAEPARASPSGWSTPAIR